jgi:hypothetical protein
MHVTLVKPNFVKTINIMIKYFFALIRIKVWGFCPSCNSDAPKLYDCKVCEWDRYSPFDKIKRKKYWDKWKTINNEQNI